MESTETVRTNEGLRASAPFNLQKSPLEIVEVTTSAQLKQFLQLPRQIYADRTSPYVMPLELHMKMMMGKLGASQKHFFLAMADGRPVARMGVKVHTVGKETHLHWGFFESMPDFPETAKLMIEKAHSMYPHLEMMGPFHFRQEDPYVGILVDGFQYDPYFMMPWNPPTYDSMIKAAGMEPVMDLYTYDRRKSEPLPEAIKEKSAQSRKELNLTMRTLDPKNLEKEARIIAGIFNEALSENWGFEEFMDDQIKEMVQMFKFFVDPRVVAFAQVDGKDIGCLIMIPNYNHLIKPCYGKLTPGLLMRYFGRKKTTTSIRGYALGVLKAYHGKGVGSALTDEMFKIAMDTEYEDCEISWVLANNSPMNEMAKALGGKQNKVYRIYKKDPIATASHN